MVRSEREAGWRVHRCWCSQHVAGVTERWNVADRGHVSGEGGGVKGAALGKVFKVVVDLFALFGFARHFSVSGLNSFFLHSQGSVNLNKNQLFFLCFHPFFPNHPGIRVPHVSAVLAMCQDKAKQSTTPTLPTCRGYANPPPQKNPGRGWICPRKFQEIPSRAETSEDEMTKNCWQSLTRAKHDWKTCSG